MMRIKVNSTFSCIPLLIQTTAYLYRLAIDASVINRYSHLLIIISNSQIEIYQWRKLMHLVKIKIISSRS